MNNLILVAGKKRTGKDIVSNMFIERGYSRLAFATKMKCELETILNEVYHIPLEKIHLWEGDKEAGLGIFDKEGNELSTRKCMQIYGQFMKTIFSNNHWTDHVINLIKSFYVNNNIIISDTRFPFEIERIKEQLSKEFNIYTVYVKRDTGLYDSEISENSLHENMEWDFVLDNNSTIEDLEAICNVIYRRINKGV